MSTVTPNQNDKVCYLGGARVGGMGASWPLARLTVTRDRLMLKIRLLGTFEFTPQDIVSIDPQRSIPLIGAAIRIRHKRTEYPEEITFGHFSCSGRPLCECLRSFGYVVSNSAV